VLSEIVGAIGLGALNGSVYALVGAGLSLTYGKQNLIDIANPAFVIVGAYLVLVLTHFLHMDPLATAPIVLLLMFSLGALVYRSVVRPLLRRPEHDMHMQSALVLFGLSLLIQTVLVMQFSADFRGLTTSYTNTVVTIVGARFPVVKLVAVVFALTTVGGLFAFLHRTFVGRAALASYANRDLAQLVGINTRWVDLLTYAVGTAFAGLAGVIVAIAYSFSPASVVGWMVIGFAVAVVGGKGSTLGILLAGFLVGLVESVVSFTISPSWLYVAVYLLLLLAFVLRPQGLLGERL
jgi:branched-chain amino acid transport system permease protein